MFSCGPSQLGESFEPAARDASWLCVICCRGQILPQRGSYHLGFSRRSMHLSRLRADRVTWHRRELQSGRGCFTIVDTFIQCVTLYHFVFKFPQACAFSYCCILCLFAFVKCYLFVSICIVLCSFVHLVDRTCLRGRIAYYYELLRELHVSAELSPGRGKPIRCSVAAGAGSLCILEKTNWMLERRRGTAVMPTNLFAEYFGWKFEPKK